MSWKFAKWFNVEWYLYLFSDLKRFDDGIWHKPQVILCRIKGHPSGPIWYSNGFEPDMSCKNCGDHV